MSIKILVCGSRYHCDYQRIYNFLSAFDDAVIISGACRGADTLAIRAAKELGFTYREYPANWAKYGKRAGVFRNQEMIDMEHPDLVIAFHNDIEKSKGTKDMINRAKYHNIDTIVVS